MNNKQWEIRSAGKDEALELSQRCGIGLLAAKVLCARGMDTPEKAEAYLCCDESKLHDPFLLADMDRAAARIRRAITDGETIAVYGDYDADGVTSVCILTDYLQSRGAQCLFYIPDRVEEGYGVNSAALDKLKSRGVTLIITVDTGISACGEARYAASLGMDMVITDHHECPDCLPAACAVINPHRHDCTYPFKDLAGVGVVFKLICALDGKTQAEMLERCGDLVALGTVADVMPLIGENRIMAAAGFRCIKNTGNIGLKALIQAAGAAEKPVDSRTVAFILAPRINAAGRMESANTAVDLLSCKNEELAKTLAAKLCRLNTLRQQTETEICNEAEAMLHAKDFENSGKKAIVLWKKGWHPGVLGIVCSRIAEKYGCPVILAAPDENGLKGSGRSIKGFNLFEALKALSEYIGRFGGHELAAGLSMTLQQAEIFREHFETYAQEAFREKTPQQIILIDCVVKPDELTLCEAEGLAALEPFGEGNPQPVFCFESAKIDSVLSLSEGRHTKLHVQKDDKVFTALCFGSPTDQFPYSVEDSIDLAFCLEINRYRGAKNLQLTVRDIRPKAVRPEEPCRAPGELYRRFTSGFQPTQEEAVRLLPERNDFIALWYCIKRISSDGSARVTPDIIKHEFGSGRMKTDTDKTLVALDVFEEVGIFSLEREADFVTVHINQTGQKADINASKLMIRLREACAKW